MVTIPPAIGNRLEILILSFVLPLVYLRLLKDGFPYVLTQMVNGGHKFSCFGAPQAPVEFS